MKILMVCLGNICRSPVAEGVMREKIKQYKLQAIVDSAGTAGYHTGEHPDKRSVLNAKKHGVDISKLVARQFKVNDFDDFDVIYTMDSSNYSDVIGQARNEKDKTKVRLILNEIYPDSDMSVPDPYYGGDQGFENVFILLEKACDAIATRLSAK